MEILKNGNEGVQRLRYYSSLFSRSVFMRLIKFNDFSKIDMIRNAFDSDQIAQQITYGDYLDKIYLSLVSQYRNEYVVKNALINKIVATNKCENITVFNEFRVGDSIADVVTFNGKSRAYEIKTELDSPKRLCNQSDSYLKFFNESYIVVPGNKIETYLSCIDDRIGIIAVSTRSEKIAFSKYRRAETLTDNMDVDVLMRVLRISEMEYLVKKWYGKLPDVGYFEMYDACKELIRKIPAEKLSRMVVQTIKMRKEDDIIFNNNRKSLTQICLALNINSGQYAQLCKNLNKTINPSYVFPIITR